MAALLSVQKGQQAGQPQERKRIAEIKSGQRVGSSRLGAVSSVEKHLKMCEVYSKSGQVPRRALSSMSGGAFKRTPAAVRMGDGLGDCCS